MKKKKINKIVKLHNSIIMQEKKYRDTCSELTMLLAPNLDFEYDCLHSAVIAGDGLCLCFEYEYFNHVIPILFLLEYFKEHESINYEEIRKLSI